MTPPYEKEFIILAFGVQLKNDDEVEGKSGEPTQRLKNSPENVQNIWGGRQYGAANSTDHDDNRNDNKFSTNPDVTLVPYIIWFQKRSKNFRLWMGA